VSRPSELEELLAFQVKATRLPQPERQLAWGAAIGRKWVLDFAWESVIDHEGQWIDPLAVEVDGGTLTNGRHVRGLGREDDMVKDAALVAAGWRVLRVSETMVRGGWAVRWIAAALRSTYILDPKDFPSSDALRKTRKAARRR